MRPFPTKKQTTKKLTQRLSAKRRLAALAASALFGIPGLLLLGPRAALAEDPPMVAPAEVRSDALLEVAILLDTSNSMDGLINQARTRLWAIVNSLGKADKDGKAPNLKVALFEYGNNSLGPENGYIRQVVELTDDLDRISEALFALTTNGGDEYCGQVIERAVAGLAWTGGEHYKAIFIAGNEPFTQGPIDFKESAKAALGKGIVINTIHCGREEEGRNGQWDAGARLADGRFMNIDQNAEEVAIAAPQDERLRELNEALNRTYIGYGVLGEARKARQEKEDSNAAGASAEALVQRAAAKSGNMYRNSAWDIIDAVNDGTLDLDKAKDEELPEEMRKLDAEGRKAWVSAKTEERKKVQAEIQTLAAEREKFVAVERAKLAQSGTDTFETAVQGMLKEQLAKKGYSVRE